MQKDSKTLSWLIIILGGFFQVGWSVGLNYTNGMTNIIWDVIVIVSLIISIYRGRPPHRSDGLSIRLRYKC